MAGKKPKAPPEPAVVAYYEDFRARLIQMRNEAKLSQEQLATLLGIPHSNYKQIEGARRTRFPLHKIESLALAVRKPFEYVLTGKVTRPVIVEDRKRA